MIYILMFVMLFLFSFTNKKYDKVLYIFSIILLFLVGALRAQTIGVDTKGGYKEYYNYILRGDPLLYVEQGWVWLNKLAINLGLGYQGVLIFAMALCLVPTAFVIYKMIPKNKCFALYIYYCSYLYLHAFNMIRQCIAMSFCLLAFYFFSKQLPKVKRFSLITGKMITRKVRGGYKCIGVLTSLVIAFLFHKSALVFVLIFIFLHFAWKYKSSVSFCFIALLIGVVGPASLFIALAGPYAGYLLKDTFGFRENSNFALLLSIVVNFIFFLYLYLIRNKLNYSPWRKMYLLGIMLMNFTFTMELGTRLIYYFTQGQIFFYSEYFTVKKKDNVFLKIMIMLYYAAVFFKIFIAQIPSLTPYTFFFLQ